MKEEHFQELVESISQADAHSRGHTKLPTTTITTNEIDNIMDTNKDLEKAIGIGRSNISKIQALIVDTEKQTKAMKRFSFIIFGLVLVSIILVIISITILL